MLIEKYDNTKDDWTIMKRLDSFERNKAKIEYEKIILTRPKYPVRLVDSGNVTRLYHPSK